MIDREMLCRRAPAADDLLPENLLTVRDLRKSYRSGEGRLEVLRGVDFDLEPGGFVAVVGQSGSGKSTLLQLMGLLDVPDSGAVHLDGRRIDALPTQRRDRLRNESIGMVFQAYHLLPELDAVENVLAPLFVRHGVVEWLRVRRGAPAPAAAPPQKIIPRRPAPQKNPHQNTPPKKTVGETPAEK
jgi:lipoprotein-releasing system ATP-binding protein